MTSPTEPHTGVFSHINGPRDDLLDRLAVAEICKGWPVYRDASEWQNFRSLFAPKATVWTTWSGPCDIDAFINVSKEGKARGVFIQHRECGTLVELGPDMPGEGYDVEGDTAVASQRSGNDTVTGTGTDTAGGNATVPSSAPSRSVRRAVGKMKATITQRFVNPGDGIEFDVDCDCRFLFFLEKIKGPAGDAAWRTVYVKLFYEKDKIVPADGHSTPALTAEERAYMQDELPEGYRYLGVMQRRLGYAVDAKLPTPRNAGWEAMYKAMEAWLVGDKAEL
ncbi:hypothetical protein HMPREF1624_05308 [Sporothrix schenckii ATCC 58251]|uniref:SnoaL-like domain-containing protein n=1 Tax=Sporothrix schenckii (strain ATCC 58251 / de Perez 2211183) TaxID=1391915 RepID=U7PUV7_SPOS1|nr:hypothetical protein HMPREF1624_05308 [Sporothrix schenckii ATCC 58251]